MIFLFALVLILIPQNASNVCLLLGLLNLLTLFFVKTELPTKVDSVKYLKITIDKKPRNDGEHWRTGRYRETEKGSVIDWFGTLNHENRV